MSEIDLQRLQEEFGVIQEPIEVEYNIPEEQITPDRVLQENVVKANLVLDRIINEMENGNFSARMAEVAAKVVESITNIASVMGNISNQFADLQTKLEMIKLKEKQIQLQERKITNINKIGNQNILVTNREDLLKLLKGENKLIENVKGEGEYDERNP